MSQGRVFGHIQGYRVGHLFNSREEAMHSGVHAVPQQGIHGDSDQGAFSICLSGGYEDNDDRGEKIIYVGSGGQDKFGAQVAGQSFDDAGNKALQISSVTKRPVRVVRGGDPSKTNYYAPASGYRYDGLYVVDSATQRLGKKGFTMCFFELRRIREEGDGPLPTRRLLDSKKLAKIRKQAGAR